MAASTAKQIASWDVGTTVVLLTSDGEEVSGQVMSHDEASGVVILRQPGSTPFHSNLRVLQRSHIESIKSEAPPSSPQDLTLPYIDVQRCRDREARAIQAADLEAAKVGVDVTPEAQKIFDGLAKTMPCRWQGHTVVVLDEVIISPPYTVRSCSQLAPNAKLFDRVQKVLSAERAKLGLGD